MYCDPSYNDFSSWAKKIFYDRYSVVVIPPLACLLEFLLRKSRQNYVVISIFILLLLIIQNFAICSRYLTSKSKCEVPIIQFMSTYGSNPDKEKLCTSKFYMTFYKRLRLRCIAFVHTSRQVPHNVFLRIIYFETTNKVL